ncbi:MAG: hypothetical protein RL090_1938, partial [Bacteroidota bacterium]
DKTNWTDLDEFTNDLINRFQSHDSIKNDAGGLPSPPHGETNFENPEVQILRSN